MPIGAEGVDVNERQAVVAVRDTLLQVDTQPVRRSRLARRQISATTAQRSENRDRIDCFKRRAT